MRFLFILMFFVSIMNTVFSQGITKEGQSTNTTNSFVDKNGQLSNSSLLNKNGQLLSFAILSTYGITSLTGTTSSSGGNITDDGGAIILERGVCWNINPNPTIVNSKTIDGNGIGSFTSNLTGLSIGTTYYVRAYAINSVGVVYGNQESFTTLDVPALTTNSINNILPVSALGGGNITNNGGASITERGVCWSISSSPTIANSKTVNGSGVGNFTSNIIQLLENATYYVRAYATNGVGTAYGNQLVFTTSSFPNCGTVTDIDGNTYSTVQINNQCWMKENIKVTHYPSGTAIPYVTDGNTWGNLLANNTDDAFCFYNNNTSSQYGALYNWAAAMGDNAVSSSANPSGVQGVCPDGWHLPSSAEWQELKTYVTDNGYPTNEGYALKSVSNWNSNNNGGNNFGFNGMPGGIRFGGTLYSGTFVWIGVTAKWWASDELNGTEAYMGVLQNDNLTISNGGIRKYDGCSIRCIKD